MATKNVISSYFNVVSSSDWWMEQNGYCSKSELPDYFMIENPLNCARMQTLASQFYTLIKHAFSYHKTSYQMLELYHSAIGRGLNLLH